MAQYNITIDSEILHYIFLNGEKNEGVAKFLESVTLTLRVPNVTSWNSRPLREKSYPFIIVDAMIIRVREDGFVLQRLVGFVIGI